MKVVEKYPNSVFNWVDLSTSDIAGAKAFYSGLFGWAAEDQPLPDGNSYTMFTLHGYNVAGGGQMSPEMAAGGMPPSWSSYVKHDDADAVAARISAAGGQLMLPPMDVMDAGRMLMAADTGGAVFGVWQPRNHIGAQLCNMPNTLVWNELQTRETAAAKQFYESVFGWTNKTDANGYILYYADGRMQAGGMAIDDSWGDVPNNWAVYFLVEDVQQKCDRAASLGGRVMVPPTAAGEMGTFAVIADPQGAVFSIMYFAVEVDPPPGH